MTIATWMRKRAARHTVLSAKPASPRVLFVATIVGTLWAFLIPHMKMLEDRGWHVEAAARLGKRSRAGQLAKIGVPAHHIPFRRRVFAAGNVVALWRLWRVMQAGHYDLIHVHTPIAAMIGRVAARVTRPRPVVLYTAHGFHFYQGAPWLNWLLSYPAERLAARWTDGLIVMNEEDSQHGEGLGFVRNENLFSVHGVGVDLDLYGGATGDEGGRIRNELGLSANDVLVTCAAGFTRRKNHKLLLDAWRCLPDSLTNAHLLLVGSGPLLPAIEHELDSWHHLPVHIAGYRSDVPSILKATDVSVLTSCYEGLPRCIQEAMAAGKAVVATNVRGSRDLIEHGSNGLLVETDDSTGFAEALATLIRDPGLRNRMGLRGREMIKDCALDLVLDEMWPIYDRFSGSGSSV